MHIAINNSTLDISNINTTKKLAEDFINHLKRGSFVCLYGEVGVGKTTFVKHFINAYQRCKNIQITEVTSPTFSLLNEYQLKDIRIKHYDLFRISRKEDLKNLDIFEKDNKLITLIEWPQLLNHTQNIKSIDLTFYYLNDLNDRSVDIKV